MTEKSNDSKLPDNPLKSDCAVPVQLPTNTQFKQSNTEAISNSLPWQQKRCAESPKAKGSTVFAEEIKNSRPNSGASHISQLKSNGSGRHKQQTKGGAGMIKAEKITFFAENQTGDSSPTTSLNQDKSDFRQGVHEAYTLDEDNKSYEEGLLDDEEEERAVAEFVSDFDLRKDGVKLRDAAGSGSEEESNEKKGGREREKDDDEESQQFSIDDVTDDEEGDQEQAALPDPANSCADSQREEDFNSNRNDNENEQKKSSTEKPESELKAEQNGKSRGAQTAKMVTSASSCMNKQISTTFDSGTNRYSSSSNDASKNVGGVPNDQLPPYNQTQQNQQRLEHFRPQAVISPPRQDIQLGEKAISSPSNQATETTPVKLTQTSKASLRKVEPQLQREDIVKGHFKKFLAHMETREINKGAPSDRNLAKPNSVRTHADRGEERSRSKSEDSGVNKDNEDPNATVENQVEQFDPKELKELFDGWSLYKKTRISFAPVRRYQFMVDQDYKKNKVTVCAHLQNIYNSFVVKRGKATHQMNNFFDIEKWLVRMGDKKEVKEAASPTKELRRVNTLAQTFYADEQTERKENLLLTKSNSTAHIPENTRAKNARRAYANFDKDNAVRMFGYRVIFKKGDMANSVPQPDTSQNHKPLSRFVNDIVNELSSNYQPIHRYHTKQRILIAMPDSEDEEEFIEGLVQGSQITSMNNSIDKNQQQFKSNDGTNELIASQALSTSQSLAKKMKSLKRLGGEIVVLKTRQGEKQSFLKKSKNLLWHCAPPERQSSATSQAKRMDYAKNSSAYGSQSFYNGSPVRNVSISPKKPQGWSLQKTGVNGGGQTQATTIKQLNCVRYQNMKVGTVHPPGQSGQHSLRCNPGATVGGVGNHNFNNFRRQNSFRKGQRGRIDSAKGGRGMRQSMENQCNPAYRLIKQQQPDGCSSNHILQGGQPETIQDEEVAQITGQAESNNVVHLRDPKHIQGFGSNVVHVNVSCGQTAQEQSNAPNSTDQKANPQQKSETKKETAPPEEDEDAQTFIIQLSEDQTRQLAEGSLKLNGVPIPKDLSNLNYEQIMALLDSVTLPPSKASDQKQTPQPQLTQSSSLAKKTPLDKRDLRDHAHTQQQRFGSDPSRKNAGPILNQTLTNGGQTSMAQNAGKKYQQSFQQAKSNQMMGTTFTDSKSKAFQQQAGNNSDYIRHQQTYYAQSTGLTSQMVHDNMMLGATRPGQLLPAKQASTVASLGYSSKSAQVKPGREIVRGSGRGSSQQHYSGAPLKVQRLESANRRARANRQQQMSFSGKNDDAQVRQQRMRQQKGKSSQSSVVGNPSQPVTNVGLTRNNGPASVISGGPQNGPQVMGNSELEMLNMLSLQQQQLKNAQHFLQHTSVNLEHQRKLQNAQVLNSQDAYQNLSAGSQSKAVRTGMTATPSVGKSGVNGNNEHYNRAMIGQIQANKRTLLSNNEPGQPAVQNTIIRAAQVVSSNGAATSSQQMIQTQYAVNQAQTQSSFNYGRQGVPSQINQISASQQQKSMTHMNSKKRINQNGSVRKASSNELGHSNSRSFIKASNHTGGQINAQQASARVASQQSLSNPVVSVASSFKEKQTSSQTTTAQSSQQPQIIFPSGKMHTNLIAHETQLLNHHHLQQQQTVFKQSGVGSGGNNSSSSKQSMAPETRFYPSASVSHQPMQPAGSLKVSSTKNQQMSKTSIELEYQKLENNSVGNLIQKGGKMSAHAPHQSPGIFSNLQQHQASLPHGSSTVNSKVPIQNAQVAASQYYHTRLVDAEGGSTNTGVPMQKLRINQQALNSNNLNYSNQSSTHKRKIESALAQSAMNAIQSQNNSHHGTLQIAAASGSAANTSVASTGAKNQFLQFEQKAYSQPQNDMTAAYNQVGGQPILNQTTAGGFLVKSNEFRKQQPHVAQPAFIMRNIHQSLTQSDIQAGANIASDYQVGSQLVNTKLGPNKQLGGITSISSALKDITANAGGPQYAGQTKTNAGYNFMQQRSPRNINMGGPTQVMTSKPTANAAQQQANSNGLVLHKSSERQ